MNGLNRSTAVSYATRYTDNTGGSSTSSYNNSAYKVFAVGNDCANFVSQCLKYGGWQYVSPYTSVSSYSVWWYNNHNTTSTSYDDCSLTWDNADALWDYVCEVNHYAAYTTSLQVYAGTVGLADLIWTPKLGIKDHVMMVTSISHPTSSTTSIRYSSHTNNRLNYTRTSYAASTHAIFGPF